MEERLQKNDKRLNEGILIIEAYERLFELFRTLEIHKIKKNMEQKIVCKLDGFSLTLFSNKISKNFSIDNIDKIVLYENSIRVETKDSIFIDISDKLNCFGIKYELCINDEKRIDIDTAYKLLNEKLVKDSYEFEIVSSMLSGF